MENNSDLMQRIMAMSTAHMVQQQQDQRAQEEYELNMDPDTDPIAFHELHGYDRIQRDGKVLNERIMETQARLQELLPKKNQ